MNAENRYQPAIFGSGFDQQLAPIAERNLLYQLVKKVAAVELSQERVDEVIA